MVDAIADEALFKVLEAVFEHRPTIGMPGVTSARVAGLIHLTPAGTDLTRDGMEIYRFACALKAKSHERAPSATFEEEVEAAYWLFDHARKCDDGMTERDAFKGQLRKVVAVTLRRATRGDFGEQHLGGLLAAVRAAALPLARLAQKFPPVVPGSPRMTDDGVALTAGNGLDERHVTFAQLRLLAALTHPELFP